jgi:hypothetical protein
MSEKPDKYRVQLDFTPESFRELEDLREEVGASSRADTIRSAMRILRWAIDELKSGENIMVSKNGEIAQVVFPFLPKLRERRPEETDQAPRRRRGSARTSWGSQHAQVDPVESAIDAGRRAYRSTVARSHDVQAYESEEGKQNG